MKPIIPIMRTALEQIQEMHKPVDPVFNWKTGLTLRPPCPDCNGKAGVHDCGCWSDKDIEYECSYCNDFGNPRRTSVLWPCATRKLADEALTDRMARTNQGESK